MALESSLPAAVRVRILERLTVLYRRIGEHRRSLESCEELIARSEFSFIGYEGAALYYEYRSRDLEAASKVLDQALVRTEGLSRMDRRRASLQARKERIERKLQKASRVEEAQKPLTAMARRRKGIMVG